jgi:hypothetical protein
MDFSELWYWRLLLKPAEEILDLVEVINQLANSISRVLTQKLTVPQLFMKFPTFYGMQRFITTFTTACNMSLSSARSVQFKSPLPI